MQHFPRERGKDSSYNRLRSHNETGGMFYGLKGESGRLARLVGRFGAYGHDVSSVTSKTPMCLGLHHEVGIASPHL